MADPLSFLDAELDELREGSLYRDPASSLCTPELLNLCSNDYLGYGALPWPIAPDAPSGSGAARLVTSHRLHDLAELALADWLGVEGALVYSSGYAANVGLISALAGPDDLVVSDALNHASIIDGCRLSRARLAVTPHLDVDAVADALRAPARRRFVVTESLFSMDGDSPDLASLRSVCDRAGAALLVDEAHALGVLGPSGRGLAAAAGVSPDGLVGTFGKALGLQGAFVAGSTRLRTWLWNRSRPFVFSTGVSPALAFAISCRVAQVRKDDEARVRAATVASAMRAAIGRSGAGPVIPWIVGSPESAVAVSAGLRAEGLLARPIRPPTVPAGTSRVRLTASAGLAGAALDRALAGLRAVAGRFT